MKKLSIFLILVLCFAISITAFPYSVNTQLTDNTGTIQANLTFSVTLTCINDSSGIFYTNSTTASTNVNGYMNILYNIPNTYNNTNVQCKYIVNGSDTGYKTLGFAKNAENSQYLQGQPASYYTGGDRFYFTSTQFIIGNSNFSRGSGYKETAIGENTRVNGSDVVVIGNDAIGCGDANPDCVAIGAHANAGTYRCTAVGFNANCTVVSGTAIGRGAKTEVAHGLALGRGAWVPDYSVVAGNTVSIGFGPVDLIDIYFDNGWGTVYTMSEQTGIVEINRTAVGHKTIIHGLDYYDMKGAISGSPMLSQGGGDLVLAAGRGTGKGKGGNVRLQVAPAVGVDNNNKNTLVDGIYINSSQQIVMPGLAGTGNDYVCVNSAGLLYRSDAACS